MNEPTEEQIKEFWEWCGIKFEERLLHDRQSGAEFAGVDWLRSYCIYPDGRKETGYPLLDPNNLFKYAVPRTIFKMTEKWERSNALDILFANWLHEWKLNHKDPALALFWAIWEVMGK